MAWSFIAQRAVTGEFLEWDLPLRLSELTWELSGPGVLSATLSPDVGALRGGDGRLILEEWGTYIFAEADEQIRWGGIVTLSEFDGDSWKLEAAGFSGYASGIPYLGEFSQIGVDPADCVKEIWRHIQEYPDGNIDLTVIADPTPIRLGTDAWDETVTADDGTTSVQHHDAEPYLLAWYEAPDCGQELNDLAKATPFDYVERHYWASPLQDEIVHELQVAYPRVGRKRDDLAFVQGDNVLNVAAFESMGSSYANEVTGIGAGEGRAAVHRTTSRPDGRLRRAAVYSDKAISTTDRMDAIIADELEARRGLLQITSIDVVSHANAPIGSWQVGDDILVRTDVPWLGEVDLWCRITAWSVTGEHTATLTLARSDSFRYGG